MVSALKCIGLCKNIGGKNIIDHVNLEIKQGEIFGFLGPNGAGKTTTIRMLTGLMKPTSGEITIMGYSLKSERIKALQQIGAIIENPEVYPYLSGWQNLKLFARMDKRITDIRIEEVTRLVKLSDRIHDKASIYSLGMKQRLGLALALLSRPSMLILDEPINGLDPLGIIDFRHMIKKLAREQGIAVLISSHILGEIEQLCDRVSIINHGRIYTVDSMTRIEDKFIQMVGGTN